MTIADTIKSLKPGDRVRVTREQTIKEIMHGYAVVPEGPFIAPDDPTITSIEVIERPLQVGDRVAYAKLENAPGQGILLATDQGAAWVRWDEGCGYFPVVSLSDLRRAS